MGTLGIIYITTVLQRAADAYSAGTYNSSTYSASGGLANTGMALGLFVGVAALIIVLAILVRVWRRPNKKSDKEPPTD
ncbi:MAG TPA: hypothetical protein VLF91_01640 [Candidatus Saccharimonadales bacterium]|nr:hypothetical protein [Candidatus Saccharimonadales bacterium]